MTPSRFALALLCLAAGTSSRAGDLELARTMAETPSFIEPSYTGGASGASLGAEVAAPVPGRQAAPLAAFSGSRTEGRKTPLGKASRRNKILSSYEATELLYRCVFMTAGALLGLGFALLAGGMPLIGPVAFGAIMGGVLGWLTGG